MSGINALFRRLCTDTAVYWAPASNDNYGKKVYAAPSEIKCFWQETTLNLIDDKGREILTSAVVHVMQDITENSYLYKGALDDLTAAQLADPRLVNGAQEVILFEKKRTLYGDAYNRRAMIGRKGSLSGGN